ncbi:conserved hypothetical protein [Ricinus communis]|uniref:Uncharacterized protein n=1 Tax=Ricinus communis TaxID=3988 RepID=B9SH51_RICCO|nr:conserved hypothetical protein [Ricinus communis]
MKQNMVKRIQIIQAAVLKIPVAPTLQAAAPANRAVQQILLQMSQVLMMAN